MIVVMAGENSSGNCSEGSLQKFSLYSYSSTMVILFRFAFHLLPLKHGSSPNPRHVHFVTAWIFQYGSEGAEKWEGKRSNVTLLVKCHFSTFNNLLNTCQISLLICKNKILWRTFVKNKCTDQCFLNWFS